eukprot:CAMPEP_0194037348 /NCGR_PEP_ID=MMETSP0009_2-20130614/9686_1 /TAXON_ID=210454 /ORGANISM="Grammatophora oceanica, Strain CCMP 410" /LENGTH=148 /DNA_ID=CAMNT_0038679459 /DNA_START=24 /DNA_END=466 /DNA_ORIENTATION=+
MTPFPGCYLPHCYCQMCRRFSGAALATWTYCSIDDFEWICDDGEEKEEPLLVRTSVFGQRHMCPTCACNLTVVYDGEGLVWPAVGCLDDECFTESIQTCTDGADATTNPKNNKNRLDAHLKEVAHIFCRTVPVWYRIPSDGLSQWDAR